LNAGAHCHICAVHYRIQGFSIMDLAAAAQSLRSGQVNSRKNMGYFSNPRSLLGGIALIAAAAGWYTANHFGLPSAGPVTFPAVSHAIALSLAGLFALAGASHIISANLLRGRYRPRNFAPGFTRMAGLAELLAALLLAIPQTRIWGGILAAVILFATVVSLLNRGKYLYAVPAMLAMAALVPAIAVTN
jgi:hypothetical protein